MIPITGMDTPAGRAAEAEYMRKNRWIDCIQPGCDSIGRVWTACCACGALLLPPNTPPPQFNLPMRC